MKPIPGRTPDEKMNLGNHWAENEIHNITSTLYVAGGLYGNPSALKTILEMAQKDEAEIIFNGDFHWFDKNPDTFMKIQETVLNHYFILGNVEAELIRNDESYGCGCAYPQSTSDTTVKRSNQIHRELKNTHREYFLKSVQKEKLSMSAQFNIGKFNISVSHGDEKNLSGWGCSKESLENPDRKNEIICWMTNHNTDVLAVSHTCSPVLLKARNKIVINNGAAGMPDFEEFSGGIIIRISLMAPENAVYTEMLCKDNQFLYVSWMEVEYDRNKFLDWFDSEWPKGSPAFLSYRRRIEKGADAKLNDCVFIYT